MDVLMPGAARAFRAADEPNRFRRWWVVAGCCLGYLLVLVAWSAPSPSGGRRSPPPQQAIEAAFLYVPVVCRMAGRSVRHRILRRSSSACSERATSPMSCARSSARAASDRGASRFAWSHEATRSMACSMLFVGRSGREVAFAPRADRASALGAARHRLRRRARRRQRHQPRHRREPRALRGFARGRRTKRAEAELAHAGRGTVGAADAVAARARSTRDAQSRSVDPQQADARRPRDDGARRSSSPRSRSCSTSRARTSSRRRNGLMTQAQILGRASASGARVRRPGRRAREPRAAQGAAADPRGGDLHAERAAVRELRGDRPLRPRLSRARRRPTATRSKATRSSCIRRDRRRWRVARHVYPARELRARRAAARLPRHPRHRARREPCARAAVVGGAAARDHAADHRGDRRRAPGDRAARLLAARRQDDARRSRLSRRRVQRDARRGRTARRSARGVERDAVARDARSGAKPRRRCASPTGARTNSWRCSRTSCAIRWRRCATRSRS